ncbi:MAG: hypothetical protein R3B06_19600 [Kofleriaceae bacterium]
MFRPWTFIPLALGLALATAATAQADVVGVMSVAGDSSGDYETILEEAARANNDVIDSTAWNRAADKRGVGSSSDRDIGEVARVVGADAVLDGRFRREGDGYVFRIRIRDRGGVAVRTVIVEQVAPRLGPRGRRAVIAKINAELGDVLRGRRHDDDDDRAVPADDRDAAVDDRRRDRRDDVEDEPDLGQRRATDDEAQDEDDDADRPRRRRAVAAREIRRAAIVFESGVMALNRTLTFSSRPNFMNAPKGYKGTFVPAARLSVELYPLAFASPHGAASGLGLYGTYEQAFLLTTRSDKSPDLKLATAQSHWEVGARFRYAFGDRPSYPSITVGVGYSRRAFTVDRTALVDRPPLDLPDVDYRAIEPGLQVRIPAGTERLAFGFAGQALLVRTTGPIQSMEEYGSAAVTGIAGGVSVDAVITPRVLLRLRADVTQVGFDFTGNGAQSSLRDGSPEQDVGGAIDRWLGAAANLAIVY